MTTSDVTFLIKDMHKRGLRVFASLPDFTHRLQASVGTTPEWVDDWEPHAGTMVDAIKEMDWVFALGVAGKRSGHDILSCDECGEVQMVDKAKGAPSARKKCIMTVQCKGYLRRLPEIFEVIKKEKKKSHHKKADPNAPKAERKKRGYREEIRLMALELLDSGSNQSQVCRQLRELYPGECQKISVATISTWRLQRDRVYAVDA